MAGADLTEANLAGVNLAGRDLSSANLRGAVLVGANLAKANLSNAILEEADLTQAILLGANLTGAKLTATKLRRAKLIGALLDVNALDNADTFGAAVPKNPSASPVILDFLQHATSMAWNEAGDLIFTGNPSGLVSIWDIATRKRVRSWHAHPETAGIIRIAYSAKGRLLASCGGGSEVKLWDIASACELKSLSTRISRICRLAFSPSETLLAISSADGAVELWDATAGECLAAVSGHKSSVEALTFSSDGRLLASGDRDGMIQVWEVRNRKSVHVFQRGVKIDCLVFNPDADRLAATSCGTPIQSWNLASGKELATVDVPSVHCLAYSPDGRILATGGEHGVSLWNAADGSPIRQLNKKLPLCISELAFDPAGRTLAGNTGFLRVWDLETEDEGEYLTETLGGVGSKEVAVHAETLATAGHNSVSYWDIRRGAEIRRATGMGSIDHIAFSPDLTKFATIDQNQLRLWESGGRELHAWNVSNVYGINCLGFDPHARFLGCGGRGGVIVYDLNRRGEAHRLTDRRRQSVLSLAFHPNGCLLAHGGNDGRIAFWDLRTFNRPKSRREHANDVTALCFSPDGTMLATGSRDLSLKLFDTTTGKLIRAYGGHSQAISKIAFSPKGQIMASGASCDSIRLWAIQTDEALQTIPLGYLISDLVFDPVGKHLVAALSDGTIRVWEAETARCVATVMPLPEGWVVFDANSRYRSMGNVAGYFWHAISLCRFEPGELDEFLPELKLGPEGPLF